PAGAMRRSPSEPNSGCTVMRRSLAEMVLIVKIASFNFLGHVTHAGGKLGSFCKINISASNPWSAKRFIPIPKYAICGQLTRGRSESARVAPEAILHTRPERHGRSDHAALRAEPGMQTLPAVSVSRVLSG